MKRSRSFHSGPKSFHPSLYIEMEEFYSSWQDFIFKKPPTVERSVCREILMMNASVPFWHEDLPLHLFTTRHVVYLWMWDAKIPLYIPPGGMSENLGALNWQHVLWYGFSLVSLFHMEWGFITRGEAADEATHITVVSTLNILHHKCLWTQYDRMCSKKFTFFFPIFFLWNYEFGKLMKFWIMGGKWNIQD